MTENNLTWLLIADSAEAHLYAMHKARVFKEQTQTKDLQMLTQLSHADSRKKGKELVTDKMGEFGRGTFVENTSAKTYEAMEFAHEVIDCLEAGRKNNQFHELILVAPPAFMGLLNKYMPANLQKLVSQTIEKDYLHLDKKELIQNLLTHL